MTIYKYDWPIKPRSKTLGQTETDPPEPPPTPQKVRTKLFTYARWDGGFWIRVRTNGYGYGYGFVFLNHRKNPEQVSCRDKSNGRMHVGRFCIRLLRPLPEGDFPEYGPYAITYAPILSVNRVWMDGKEMTWPESASALLRSGLLTTNERREFLGLPPLPELGLPPLPEEITTDSPAPPTPAIAPLKVKRKIQL